MVIGQKGADGAEVSPIVAEAIADVAHGRAKIVVFGWKAS
jgi:hypothetical protein